MVVLVVHVFQHDRRRLDAGRQRTFDGVAYSLELASKAAGVHDPQRLELMARQLETLDYVVDVGAKIRGLSVPGRVVKPAGVADLDLNVLNP